MSERTHLLVQQWLQQANLSADDLQHLTNEHPYFSAAQCLLLQRQHASAPAYAEQKQKAALHVYNPMLLETGEKTFDFPFEQIKDEHEFSVIDLPFEIPVLPTEPVSIEEKEIETFEPIETEMPDAAGISLPAGEALEASPLAENSGGDQQAGSQQPEEATTGMPPSEKEAAAVPAAQGLTFEPYHTVDYFASQGIKLSQSEAGNDRMGRQLKSFTEWLKTMKKLPATAITQNTDAPGERQVANLAEHSLQNADIITEAMAEVWLKQGNKEKASELYNKLSLQNPSKRAYFAAKIESLKKPS